MRRHDLLLLACLAATPLARAPIAQAQAPSSSADGRGEPPSTEPETSPTAPVLVPPRLERFVEADRPEGLEEAEGAVELELTIDPEGRVTDARVVGPLGNALDQAALDAAQRFQFQPATRDGEPIPARIRYRYVFEQRVETPSVLPSEAPSTGRLEGVVETAEDAAPIGGADVILTSEPDGAVERQAVAGPDGRFVFEELPPGAYRLLVIANEFGEAEYVEDVVAGEATEVVYRIRALPETGGGFTATATVEAPPREVTRRTIEREELTRVAGTRGDALRTVELLPGVGRPPFGAGFLLVRGAAPGDSQVFFEGGPVPLLYHFGGLTSFINSRLLDKIDFYPGNFSVRYGRATGGVLEVTGRDPAFDGVHGVVDINVIDASLLIEAPITDNLSIAAAARRSYVDFFFENVVPDDLFDVATAPQYYDYQLFTTWRPTDQDRVRLIVFGSSDAFQVVFPNPGDADPDLAGNLNLDTSFHRGYVGWRRQLAPNLVQDLSVSFGVDTNRFDFGDDLEFDGIFQQLYARAEWQWQVAEPLKLTAGLDIFYTPFVIRFTGPAPGQDEGGVDGGSTQEQVRVDADGIAYRPAAYVEADWRPVDPLTIIGGVRLDWARELSKWTVDPRVAARWSLDDQTVIKGGVGLFSQAPAFNESADVEGLGNPDLEWIKALHVSTGFERTIIPGIEVGLEGFFKWLWDRPVTPPSNLATDEPFVSEGVGRIYGVELSGRWKPNTRDDIPFFGFLSYTLSRSERRDGPDQEWRLFDFDQTHIFTLSGVYQLPKGWEIGATFRLVTGNPYTPFEGSQTILNDATAIAFPGAINSRRNRLFHRLDFRVEKQWQWARGGGLSPFKLALYLDVQNVYNSMNPEGFADNFDYTDRVEIPGLPIIPSLGIRGEL